MNLKRHDALQFRLGAAVPRNPSAWAAHSTLGIARRHQGRSAEAARHFIAALDIDPSFAGVRANLAALAQGVTREAATP